MGKLEIYNKITKVAKDIDDEINSCLYKKDGTAYMMINKPLIDSLRKYALRIYSIREEIEKDLNIKSVYY